MTRVFVFTNHKGGVGKSTSATNIGLGMVQLLRRANAAAERWVRSVRQECLDHLLILSQRHHIRVLTEYIDYYNVPRPYQGLDQQAPIPTPRSPQGVIRCRDVLEGTAMLLEFPLG